MNNENMNAIIAEIQERQAKAAALKKEIEALQDQLKAELDSRKVDSVDTGIHRVFYQVIEQRRVDSDKLKKAGLYDVYSKLTTQLRFQITDVKVV